MAMVMKPGLLYRELVADDNFSSSIIPSFPKIPSLLDFVAALAVLNFDCNSDIFSLVFRVCPDAAAVPDAVVPFFV